MIAVSVPALLLATLGTVAAWRRTDRAVREKTRTDALGLAEFVATSFGAVEETPPGTAPRVAHRAVTNAVRSNWSALKLVTDLRFSAPNRSPVTQLAASLASRPSATVSKYLAVACSATSTQAS